MRIVMAQDAAHVCFGNGVIRSLTAFGHKVSNMTEDNLKRGNQIQKLLNEDIEVLSDIRLKNYSEIGKALSSLMKQDDKFKDLFRMILKETKERITTEFELM